MPSTRPAPLNAWPTSWHPVASVKLTVTDADIRAGQPGSKRFCAIALSATRRLRLDVRVSHQALCVGVKRLKLPSVARDFIAAYDKGLAVQPIEFWVQL